MDPDQHRNALNRHDMLHWYEIQSILGQGGFGITYLARDTNLDQLVAIKEYLPTEFSTRDKANTVQPISENHTEIFDWGKKRFLEEAKTLAQFRHPNVVRVSSFFENNNTGYMVMEYEDGTDLARLIKAGESFDEARIFDLLLPILDGLAQIHERGFIHRDIKPANIFIRADGSPVLIDFGSARQAIGGQTRTMTSLVTPGFAPFEQYHDAEGKQGPWTDIYSLGATCYAMITGKPPKDALKRGMARLDHATDAYLHLTDLRAGKYSEHLLQAIDHALEFKQDDRPQNVSAWRAMLVGETAVPQASIVTQLGDSATNGNTQVVTRSDDEKVATTQVVTRPEDDTPTTAPDVPTEPATAPDAPTAPATVPPASTQPEVAPVQVQVQAPAAKAGKAKPVIIVSTIILLALVAFALVSKMQLQPQQASETSKASTAELEARQAEQARLAAEKEALREQQARIAVEKEQLKKEQKRIQAEKELQAELARQAADKEAQRQQQLRIAAEKEAQRKQQLRIAAEKEKQEQARIAAEEKRQAALAREKAEQELTRKQAQDKLRQQELALQQAAQAQQQHQAPSVNLAGSYTPDKGFEQLLLSQTGNRINGTIGNNGSTLEGVLNGNQLEFKFNYSRTGYGFKLGTGVLTLSADGKRLTGTRSNGGFPPQTAWSLTRSDGTNSKPVASQDPLTDASGVYKPDNGFEELKLQQNGNKIKGEIGSNGSSLEGEREGSKIIFVFSYSRTGYGFKNGHGQFTISEDGNRLSGFRSKGGFPENSSWNLSRMR